MNISDLETLCYIHEQTSYAEDYKNFGYEVFDKGNRFYLIFDAVMQSFGIRNRNRREYVMENVWKCIQTDDYIQSMLKQNSWMGEIDHPAPMIDGEKLTMNRIANPNMERTSHYIRRPRQNGNLIEATIQTDSGTDAGMNMAIKIVDGKIIPCFSARLFGALKKVMDKPVVNVNKLICYDWVLYPSHPEAMGKIKQPIQEATDVLEKESGSKIIYFPELAQMVANDSKETELLCESFGLSIGDVIGITNTGNSLVIQENANVYMQPITDRNLRKKSQNEVKNWLAG